MTTTNNEFTYMSANVVNPDTEVNSILDEIDLSMAGMLTHNMASDADYTLSTASDPEEWKYKAINITDTSPVLTAARNIIVPTNTKSYIFINNTLQDLTLKTSAGTGITVPAADAGFLYCDGTNVINVASGSGGGGGGAETVYNLTGTDIDFANGTFQYKTITANTTFTSSLGEGESVTLRLVDADLYTITWPTITWVGGEPTYTGLDFIELWYESSTLYATHVNQGASHFENILINNGFNIDQELNTTAADTNYVADGWKAFTESSSIGKSILSNPEDGTPGALRLTQTNATAQRMALCQIMPTSDCRQLRSVECSFRIRLRASTGLTVNYAAVEWTSTGDAVTADPISTWGSSLTYATNFTQLDSGSIALTANTWETVDVLTVTPGSSMTNLLVLVWTDAVAAQNVTLDFARAQFMTGAYLPPWIAEPKAIALSRTQYFYHKSYSRAVSPGTASTTGAIAHRAQTSTACNHTATVTFPATMNSSPTVTVYSPSTGTSGQILANATDFAGGATSGNESHTQVQFTSTQTLTVNDLVSFHYVADARL